jgi:hypothetical protein
VADADLRRVAGRGGREEKGVAETRHCCCCSGGHCSEECAFRGVLYRGVLLVDVTVI